MDRPTEENSRGRLDWELVDLTTGQVRSGQRQVYPLDIEVMVTPPPATPQLGQLRVKPGRVVADAAGWLLTGGRGLSTKRLRIVDGFWLVLRERRTPRPPTLVHLGATGEQPRLSGLQIFEVDAGGDLATAADEAGSLQVRWERDRDGFQELVSTTAATDLTLPLRSARGPLRRDPIWQLRILAGSTVRWPRSEDGLRLVPRLRPTPGSTARS